MKKIVYYILLIICVAILFQLIAKGYDSTTFRQEFRPTYNSTPKNYSIQPNAKLEIKNDNRIPNQLREYRNDTNEDTRYNSSCQFGVCVPGGPHN
jgi:hypothetical protein